MSLNNVLLGMHANNNRWNSGSPAHSGISDQTLFLLAAKVGSQIVRIPLDLSAVGPSGPPEWLVDSIGTTLQRAWSLGLKVVLQPDRTPADLLPLGASISQAPQSDGELAELGERFGELVEAVHSQYAQYTDTIAAWEVGNEPNLSFQNDGVYIGREGDAVTSRFNVVGLENAEAYAKYLHSAGLAVSEIEASLGQTITVVAAGIAHNDSAYMERMLGTLRSLGGEGIDGFSIHPYTSYKYNYEDPSSSRPTEWVGDEASVSARWDYFHSFQGALYRMQSQLTENGFSEADIWLTEFGVPSYLGYLNAGEAGRVDQANWYAEAFGVLDSWGNDNLKGIIAHSVLDMHYKEENDRYNSFNQDTENNGSAAIAAGSFGLYERSSADGAISRKPVVELFDAIAADTDYATSEFRVLSLVSSDVIDLTSWGTDAVGLTDGYILLTHGRDDLITGSEFSDSLFAGAGNDTVHAGKGDDRVFGGRGNDFLSGDDGNDDIYGNRGDDRIDAGAGTNRVDGGPGLDTLILSGSPSDYQIAGNGRSFTATAITGGQTTAAINVEQIYYTADSRTVAMSGGSTNAGNGGLPGTGTGPKHNSVYGTAGHDTLYGTADKDTIHGYSGHDTIFGLDQNDTIFGGDGDDVIFPGRGRNEVIGGKGTDNVIIEGPKSDYDISVQGLTIHVEGSGIQNMITHAEWIIFDAPEGDADKIINAEALLASHYIQISGTNGNDYIEGTAGNDRLLGGDGNDTLYGGKGDDVLQGEGGRYNHVYYDGNPGDYTFVLNENGTFTVESTAWGTDTLTDVNGIWFRAARQWYPIEDLLGSNGPGRTIPGSTGDNYLLGTRGDDILLGSDGDDTLYGSLGDDLLDGEAGYDHADYDGAAADYTFTREADGKVTVSHHVYGTDTLRNIEGLWFHGEEKLYTLDALAQRPHTEPKEKSGVVLTHAKAPASVHTVLERPFLRDTRPTDSEGDGLSLFSTLLDFFPAHVPRLYGGVASWIWSHKTNEVSGVSEQPSETTDPSWMDDGVSSELPGDETHWFEPEPIGNIV